MKNSPRRSLATPARDTTVALAKYVGLRRRYARSINLERDLSNPENLDGYVPTIRALELLSRISDSSRSARVAGSWTVTGVYGTGKSAFAHFLAALYAPSGDVSRRAALSILRRDAMGERLAARYSRLVPSEGFVRAVVTARHEPVARTILRGLSSGATTFWDGRPGKRPAVVNVIRQMSQAHEAGETISSASIVDAVSSLAEVSRSGLLVVIDELGKSLEYAAHSGGTDDLFILQQLAELQTSGVPIVIVGMLHQAFSEYGHDIGGVQRAEWDKVQGRFEDVVFQESPEQMLRLVGEAIEARFPRALTVTLGKVAGDWHRYFSRELGHPYVAEVLNAKRVAEVYPLHPVTALVLPTLCAKFAQNDRSLFTFLTSDEPHSLARFLAENQASADRLPTLRLPDVYAYFVDVGGIGLASRPQFQRWAEISGVIRDAVGASDDELAVLKTIGVLNLVTSSGPLRAGRALVLAALVDSPADAKSRRHWSVVLDGLVDRRLVTYRRQVDEFRIWEGSDYDVDAALRVRTEQDRRTLPDVLEAVSPLPPLVAQRHSYRTGTLRYFERHFVEDESVLRTLRARSRDADGVVAYWVGNKPPVAVPDTTSDLRPLVVVPARNIPGLRSLAYEAAALATIERNDVALQTDGVARREVRQRLALARIAIEQAVRLSFDRRTGRDTLPFDSFTGMTCWVGGEISARPLSSVLSDVCDATYVRGPVLWNELLNRRELTSQGARARRELLEALLTKSSEQRLGLEGYGPEVSMYESVLRRTGIHRPDESGRWVIDPPSDQGVVELWKAVETFFTEAIGEPRSLDGLYAKLQSPPFGVKAGVIPVMIASVLLYRSDDVSLYRDGTFVPVLGAEQFEILVKHPARFAVKHFALTGLRRNLFRELESLLTRSNARLPETTRNTSLLGVVRPLVRFATSLRATTRKSTSLSPMAVAVRDALLSATEPDRLLFETLPLACGVEPFGTMDGEEAAETGAAISSPDDRRQVVFRRALLKALAELETHYERRLEECRTRLYDAFAVSAAAGSLREHLRVRAHYLLGRCIEPRLRAFTQAAADGIPGDREWLEALAMVVADRPADTWTDNDMLTFEVNLSDIARRFIHLESLQREAAADGREGFDARRVTITKPDGHEAHQLVWLDRSERDLIDSRVERLLHDIEDVHHVHQRRAIAVALAERLLTINSEGSDAGAPAASIAKVPEGSRRRKNG